MGQFRLFSGMWGEIVLDVLGRVDGMMPWEAVCQELGRQADAPVVGTFRWTTDGDAEVCAYPFPDWFNLPDVASRAAHLHPLARHYAATGATAPMSMDQVPVPSGPSALDYLEELREDAIDQHLWIPVHRSLEEVWVAGVCRARDPFSSKDTARAEEAQRVITTMFAHCRTLAEYLPPTWSVEDRQVALDEVKLTARQIAVLALAAEGMTASAIGRRLHISPRTVERHLQNVYDRMGVRDRVSAVRRADQAGILRP